VLGQHWCYNIMERVLATALIQTH